MIGPRSSFAAFVVGLFSAGFARADLDGFVKKPDPAFAWEVVGREETKAGKITYLKLTSQTWRGKPWVHRLNIYEPKTLKYPDAMLLIISGGNNDDPPPGAVAAGHGFAAAEATGARVAMLQQVPNQPLLDGKYEDELLAESLLNAIQTGDDSWPLLFPMTKAAVRALDAVQAWAKEQGRPASKFVVTGSSKRGWTTFLTAAVDPRVIALAPMVFPNLDMKAQNEHALKSWGKPSAEIDAYTRRGLTSQSAQADAALAKVRTWIDPFTYRDRYTMPLLQINGTNDAYWTLDSLNLYWDALKGPKSVLYLPNAGHNLEPNHDWAVNGVGALFRHAVTGRAMPSIRSGGGPVADQYGRIQLTVDAAPAPKNRPVRLWIARSETKDFRQATWKVGEFVEMSAIKSGVLEAGFHAPMPDAGYVAIFADLIYEIDGLEFHLSTPIRIFGPKGAN